MKQIHKNKKITKTHSKEKKNLHRPIESKEIQKKI